MSRSLLFLSLAACSSSALHEVRAPQAEPMANFRADVRQLSARQGTWVELTVEVEAGTPELRVVTQGGTGDADLYLRKGSDPTVHVYDCRSLNAGNNETCLIEAPTAGTWHIGVHAYGAFEDVALSWANDWQQPRDQVEVVLDEDDVAVAAGEDVAYLFDVPVDAADLRVWTSSGRGDADLVVFDPDGEARCSSLSPGNDESCEIDNPEQGTWTAAVEGYVDASGVELGGEVRMLTAPPTPSPGAVQVIDQALHGCVDLEATVEHSHGTLALDWTDLQGTLDVDGMALHHEYFETDGSVELTHVRPGDIAFCSYSGVGNLSVSWRPAERIFDGSISVDDGINFDVPAGTTSVLVTAGATPTHSQRRLTLTRAGFEVCSSNVGWCAKESPVAGVWDLTLPGSTYDSSGVPVVVSVE